MSELFKVSVVYISPHPLLRLNLINPTEPLKLYLSAAIVKAIMIITSVMELPFLTLKDNGNNYWNYLVFSNSHLEINIFKRNLIS